MTDKKPLRSWFESNFDYDDWVSQRAVIKQALEKAGYRAELCPDDCLNRGGCHATFVGNVTELGWGHQYWLGCDGSRCELTGRVKFWSLDNE